MNIPEWLSERVGDDLKDAEIKGGDEYPPMPGQSVKLHGPPGTGKTTQLSLRVAILIEEHDVNPEDIAWVTYRRSLADEITDKLVDWGVITSSEVRDLDDWSTVHAVSNGVTGLLDRDRRDDDRNSLGPAVTEREKVAFSRGVLDVPFFPSEPWEQTRGQLLLNTFAWLSKNLYEPGNVAHARSCPMWDDLAREWPGIENEYEDLYETWAQWKQNNDLYEFHELLETALNSAVAPTSDVLIIDEYHDAYPLMAAVAEKWMDAADTVMVAGDPDQVVNAFRGASPEFFEQLDMPTVLLDETWRVPEEHWWMAARVLKQERSAPPVERKTRGRISEYRSPSMEYSRDQKRWLVPDPDTEASPAWLVDRHGTDMIFLTRTQKQAQGVSAALDRAGIFHTAQDDVGGWDSINERRHLFNALQKLRSLNPAAFGAAQGRLRQFDDSGKAPRSVRLSVDETIALLNHAEACYLAQSRSDTDSVVTTLRMDSDKETVTADEVDEWAGEKFWTRYTAGAASVEHTNKGSLDAQDMRAIEAALTRYDSTCIPDSIDTKVWTIHASKGSEAAHTVVYDGVTGRIQTGMGESEETAENEARTWYVALTRASEHVHLMRGGFTWTKPYLPSDLAPTAGNAAERAIENGDVLAATTESGSDDGATGGATGVSASD
ncbi:ATP-dependent helicase [Haloterrigena salifodinae]|uniref:ATP-dependent helicase n=1 Tax=Haloterrigena salifodinae TaxID=2675099 RepID=A0A8T8E3H3_9EURY|nr:ATP-dependent helicase [Haloterrigena salifodinae]QRV16308.1 ATP-dependent helicase [Haloterrigena salifodinae]